MGEQVLLGTPQCGPAFSRLLRQTIAASTPTFVAACVAFLTALALHNFASTTHPALAMSESARLLIVGPGMTGSVTYHSLKASGFPTNQITVYEKARGFGGRMSVARGKDGQVADLGAQYVTPKVPAHETYVNELLQRGVLVPFDGIIEGASPAMVSPNDMVAPQGMSSIVKHFYTGAKPAFQERVASIELLHLHSTQAAAAGSHD